MPRGRRKQKKPSLKFMLVVLLLIVVAVLVVLFIYDFDVKKLYNDIFNPSQTTETGGTGGDSAGGGTTDNNDGDSTGSGTTDNNDGDSTGSSSSSTKAPSGQKTTKDSFVDLKVHFINIGQGDCILIEFPDDKTMLIDAGEEAKTNDVKNETVISNYLADLEITTIDYLLLTHQDSDHAGNIDFVLLNYDVKYIFKPNTLSEYTGSVTVNKGTANEKTYSVSDLPANINTGFSKDQDARTSTTATYFKFLLYSYLEDCPVEVFNKDSDFGNSIVVNDQEFSYTLDFLTPTADREDIKYKGPSHAEGVNAYSPNIVLEYCGTRLLLTGDSNEVNEEEFCQAYSQGVDVDILKVGHHGSAGSSTAEFLSLVDAEYAVIQCGVDNKHDHPRQEALDRLKASGVQSVYRSDTNGHIVLTISQDGFTFDTEIDLADLETNFVGITVNSFAPALRFEMVELDLLERRLKFVA